MWKKRCENHNLLALISLIVGGLELALCTALHLRYLVRRASFELLRKKVILSQSG